MKISLLLLLKIALTFTFISFGQREKKYELNEYSVIEQNNKKGLANEKGEIIIPVKYDDLGWSKGSLHIVKNTVGFKEGYLWGLIDLNDKKITKANYYHLYPFFSSFFIAASHNYNRSIKYGVINAKGKTEVSFKYDYLSPFQHLLIASEIKNGENATGVINSKNKTLIPFRFKQINGIGKSNLTVQNENSKVALYNLDGKQLSEFIYDSITTFNDDVLLVFQAGKKGLINTSGQKLLDPQYKRIEQNAASQVNVLRYPEWTILNAQNEILKTMNYDDIIPLGQNFYKIKAGNRQGVITSHDELIVPLKEWRILKLKDDLITFCSKRKYGLLDLRGNIIVPAQYENIDLHKGFIIASRTLFSEMRYSLFNKKGEAISDEKYQEISFDSEGLFPVKYKQKWGYINERGEEVISCKFDSVYDFRNGKAKVHYFGGYGVIDQKGNWLIKPFYDELQEGSDNTYLHIKGRLNTFIDHQEERIFRTTNYLSKHALGFIEKDEDGKCQLIRPDGNKVFEHNFDSISRVFKDTALYLFRNGETAIINKSGSFLMKFDKRFQEIHPPSETFIGCKISDKYGFVDMNGKLRIANQYEAIGKFSEGLASVKILGKWGFIDKSERWAIQPYYDNASNFKQGIAIIQTNGKYGLINKEGESVLHPEYDNIKLLISGNYLIYKGNLTGLVNSKGKLILYPKFDTLQDLNNGFIVVERDQKKGLISNLGVSTIPMVYDEILYDNLNEVYIIVKSESWETVELPTSGK